MARRLYQALGLGALIALLAAAGGYGFLQLAHAQTVPPLISEETGAEAGSAGAWLGLMVVTLTEQAANRLGVPQEPGVAVVRVVPGGPAAQAGVLTKDVITRAGDTAVQDLAALKTALESVSAGETVALTVSRGGQSQQINVVAAARPERPATGPWGDRGQLHPGGGALPFLPGLLGAAGGQGFENAYGGTFTYKDATTGQVIVMKAVFGTVASVSGNDVAVKPNNGEANQTYRITPDTRMRGTAADLKADDKVVAIARDGSNDLVGLARFVERVRKEGPRAGAQQGRIRIADSLPRAPRTMERLDDAREKIESSWVY